MKKMKTRFLMLLDALMMPTRGARSLALVCVVLTAATAWAAQSWTSGGCTVTLDNNGKMTVTKSTSGDGKMDIYQAEELVPWYDYTEDVKTLVVEEGVVSIGGSAFCECYKMTSVSLPEGLKSIGEVAFARCYALQTVTIPSSVINIGAKAFGDCTAMTDVYCLPWADILEWWDINGEFKKDHSTVIHVQAGQLDAFKQKSSVVKFVGDQADIERPFVEGIPIDSQHFGIFLITYLEQLGYRDDGVLTQEEINSLTTFESGGNIGNLVGIEYLTELRTFNMYTPGGDFPSVELPKNVKLESFTWIVGQLVTLDLSKNVNLRYVACYDNYIAHENMDFLIEHLPTVKDGTIWIVESQSNRERNICTIAQVAALKKKGWTAYDKSTNQPYAGEEDEFKLFEGDVYTVDNLKYKVTSLDSKTVEVVGYETEPSGDLVIPATVLGCSVTSICDMAFKDCANLTSVTIPASVTSIGAYAICSCTGLTSLTIPNSVTSIGKFAFCACSSLTSITLPAGLTYLPEGIFWGCTGFTSYTVPEGVTGIGAEAFRGCSNLTEVIIPASVTYIDTGAFYQASALKSIYCYAPLSDLAWNMGSGDFMSDKGTTCYVEGKLSDWQKKFPTANLTFAYLPDIYVGCMFTVGDWRYRVTGDNTVEVASGPNSAEVEFPAAVSYIGVNYSVTGIGTQAFSHRGFTSVTIPSSVTYIGDRAFQYCEWLTSVTIPNSVTSIGESAFVYCESLSSLTLPDGLTSISSELVRCCFKLTSITIPDGVTSIGYDAFSGCHNLTSLTIPEGVTNISYGVFYCEKLKDVYCYADPDKLTWDGGDDTDFMENKATRFHVTDASAWEKKFPNTNVTFVGDLKPKHDCKVDGHVWGEWEEKSQPSCTEDGEKVRVCEYCGESDKDIIPAHGHIWNENDICLFCGASKAAVAIESITITTAPATDGAWYTLTGMQLEGEPTAPGIYVKDGRKVVIR